MSLPCLMKAWAAHEAELLGYLRHHCGHPADAEELLQEIFIKALRQGKQFCSVDNPRAWLFQVARNALTDHHRQNRESLPLNEEIPQPETAPIPAIDTLSQCLPRVLEELPELDRKALLLCDIEGKPQQELAEQLGISLSGAKSRLQRARLRLRQQLEVRCKVRFDERGSVCCFTPRQPQK
ncbi:MAG: ECF RNA polymerase sigma factor SigR [Betaproteobacteria bacterium ADurb.Bin341]|nr:MAG: ECF RNA polymerase sigma factor SigR [Betaproteobacteria bacterium ADurb.Bin341]